MPEVKSSEWMTKCVVVEYIRQVVSDKGTQKVKLNITLVVRGQHSCKFERADFIIPILILAFDPQ